MTEERFFEIKEALAKLIKNTIFEGKTYIVGGAVRDLYMGRDIKDVDVVVNIQGGGLKLARHLYNIGALVREPVEYPQYSVSMFVLKDYPDIEIEAVQTRKEQYLDSTSRNPETAFGTIEEDAIRRDLTINALYLNVSTNEVVDLTGGLQDIENHVIKVTNRDPDIVFDDDPLRILRVVRFASRFGWEIEKETWDSMFRNSFRLEIISIERINDEFSKMMVGENPRKALEMLKELELIQYIIPELIPLYNCRQNEYHGYDMVWEHTLDVVENVNIAPASDKLVLRLAALLHDIGKDKTKTIKDGKVHFYGHEFVGAKMVKEILGRLRYSKDIINEVAFLVENHMWFFSFTMDKPNDKVIRRVQYKCKYAERFRDLMLLMQADRLSGPEKYQDPKFFENITTYSNRMVSNNTAMFGYQLPVDGDDIMRVKGIPGGHDVRVIKDALLEHAIKCNPNMSRQSALNFIRGYNLNNKNNKSK